MTSIHQVKMAKSKDKPKESTEEPEAKVSEEVKPVEKSELPKFKNVSKKDIKIRIGKRKEPNWITVKVGQVVEIPEKLAIANKLQEVE